MTWTDADRNRAINAGKDQTRKLTDHEVTNLKAATSQAGEVGRAAQEALDNRLR